MKWYKHFTRAHRDPKIKRLVNEHGADGYAVYFYCLELIADNLESDNITFELEDDAELIGQYLKIDTLKVEKIMKKCLELELFGMSSSNQITCMKMAKFLDERYTRNPVLKQMIKSDKMQDIVKISCSSEDNVKTKRDKVREIRLDKIRLDKNIYGELHNVFLTKDEYDRLISEYGIEIITKYINSLSLYIPNKKPPAYKDHNSAIRQWLNKDDVKKITIKPTTYTYKEPENVKPLPGWGLE
jgi:hypothetical protein